MRCASGSTTSISHYFADKRDVLMATYQDVATRAAKRRCEGAALRSELVRLTPPT